MKNSAEKMKKKQKKKLRCKKRKKKSLANPQITCIPILFNHQNENQRQRTLLHQTGLDFAT